MLVMLRDLFVFTEDVASDDGERDKWVMVDVEE